MSIHLQITAYAIYRGPMPDRTSSTTIEFDPGQRAEMTFAHDDELSCALCRILELEEALDEANDTIHRLVEGNVTKWDV